MAESLERTLIAQVDRFVEGRAHELAGARQPLQTLLVGVEDVDAGDELADGRGGAGRRRRQQAGVEQQPFQGPHAFQVLEEVVARQQRRAATDPNRSSTRQLSCVI